MAQRPSPSQEGASAVGPRAHLYATFDWPFYESKDCWSAAWPQGRRYFSLACRNASGVVPFNDAKQRWLFLYAKFSKETGTVSTFFWKGALISLIWNWEKWKQWLWMKWTEGWADVGCLKSRGVAQLDLCLVHIFELLWLGQRGKNATKPNHNWLYSGGNMEMCSL